MEAIRVGAAAALGVRTGELKAEISVLRETVTLRLEAAKPSMDHDALTGLADLVKLHGLEVNMRPDFDRQSIVVEIYRKGVILCSEEART